MGYGRPVRRDGQAGFTIAEFVLVAVVITGLIVVAVVSLNGINDESDARECRSELRALKAASERFKAELTVYPVDDQKLEDAGFLSLDETPNYKVVTEGPDGEPQYVPVGDRCR